MSNVRTTIVTDEIRQYIGASRYLRQSGTTHTHCGPLSNLASGLSHCRASNGGSGMGFGQSFKVRDIPSQPANVCVLAGKTRCAPCPRAALPRSRCPPRA